MKTINGTMGVAKLQDRRRKKFTVVTGNDAIESSEAVTNSIANPIIVEGKSLYLRRTVPADAKFLYDHAYSQPEFVQLYNLTYLPKDAAEVHQHLVERSQIPPNSEKYLEMMIVHKIRGAIGICALAEYSSIHRRAEYLIGIFAPKDRSVGHGLECSLMILDLAFNRYNFHKLYALTYSGNIKARKGLESLGFQLEGTRRQHVFNPISHSFEDLCDFGSIAHEFRANQRLIPLSLRLLGRDITKVPVLPKPRCIPPCALSNGTYSWR